MKRKKALWSVIYLVLYAALSFKAMEYFYAATRDASYPYVIAGCAVLAVLHTVLQIRRVLPAGIAYLVNGLLILMVLFLGLSGVFHTAYFFNDFSIVLYFALQPFMLLAGEFAGSSLTGMMLMLLVISGPFLWRDVRRR